VNHSLRDFFESTPLNERDLITLLGNPRVAYVYHAVNGQTNGGPGFQGGYQVKNIPGNTDNSSPGKLSFLWEMRNIGWQYSLVY